MDLNTPLSEEELDELNEFLLSDTVSEECMDASMLDGFLAALVVGPEAIPFNEWIDVVWGGEEAPVFASQEQAQRVIDLIVRHMNSIADDLEQEPEVYDPIFYQDGDELVAEGWCGGFIEGMMRRAEAWEELFEAGHGHLLQPIMQVAGVTDDETEQPALSPAERQETIPLIAPAVVELYEFWRERRAQ